MRPVTVNEILTYGERLGITEIVKPSGASGSVRHLVRYAGGESGYRMTPLPDSLFILPPTAEARAYGNAWDRSVLPSLFRNISCLGLSAQRITVFLRRFSELTGTPVFSSGYDNSLLHSRLTGLLLERGERQVMVHGVLVRVLGLGVLLLGESGIGKTACGLALMVKGNLWVTDDAVVLEGRGEAVYGRGHQRTAGRIAVRGRGILPAADLLGKCNLLQETRVDMLVRLVCGSERNAVKNAESFQEIVGVCLPCKELVADVDPGRVAERVTGYVRRLLVLEKGGSE